MMPPKSFFSGLVSLVLLCLCSSNSHALERTLNTSLRMPLAPAFPGYSLSDAFGNLAFVRPVTIASSPGETNRLFVVERAGRIIVITNLTAPTETVFLDLTAQTQSSYIESGMLGLAFHP